VIVFFSRWGESPLVARASLSCPPSGHFQNWQTAIAPLITVLPPTTIFLQLGFSSPLAWFGVPSVNKASQKHLISLTSPIFTSLLAVTPFYNPLDPAPSPTMDSQAATLADGAAFRRLAERIDENKAKCESNIKQSKERVEAKNKEIQAELEAHKTQRDTEQVANASRLQELIAQRAQLEKDIQALQESLRKAPDHSAADAELEAKAADRMRENAAEHAASEAKWKSEHKRFVKEAISQAFQGRSPSPDVSTQSLKPLPTVENGTVEGNPKDAKSPSPSSSELSDPDDHFLVQHTQATFKLADAANTATVEQSVESESEDASPRLMARNVSFRMARRSRSFC